MTSRLYQFTAWVCVEADTTEAAEAMIDNWVDLIGAIEIEGLSWPDCEWSEVTYE